MSSRASSAVRERVGEAQRRPRRAAGLARVSTSPSRSSVPSAPRRASQLERQVAQRELVEDVLPLAGIEQVRHHRGVVVERPRASSVAARASAPWRGARPAAARRPPTARRARRAPRRREQLGVDVRGVVAVREPEPAQRAAYRRAVPARLERERLVARRELARSAASTAAGVAHHVDLDVEDVGLGDGGGRRRLAERLRAAGAAACGTRAGRTARAPRSRSHAP